MWFFRAALILFASTAAMAQTDQVEAHHNSTDITRFPQILVQAIEAGEDPSFRHRYVWRSPITAHVVQLLQTSKSRDHSDRLYEILKLNWAYNHNEILALFLNDAYFGRGCRGASAASQGLFQKELGEIGLAEAVMLTAILRRPSGGFADDEFMRRNVDRIAAQLLESGNINADQKRQIIDRNARRVTARRHC